MCAQEFKDLGPKDDDREGFDIWVGLCEMVIVSLMLILPLVWLAMWVIPIYTLPMMGSGFVVGLSSLLISISLFLISAWVSSTWKRLLRAYSVHLPCLAFSLLSIGFLLYVSKGLGEISKPIMDMVSADSGKSSIFEAYPVQVILMVASTGYLFKAPWDHAVSLIDKPVHTEPSTWSWKVSFPPYWLRRDAEKKA